MNSDTSMYLVFNSSDSQYKPILEDLYKGNSFKECELVHKKEFNSKPYFQKKFGSSFLQTDNIQEIENKIAGSLDRISKTKVFDRANVEMASEGEKLQVNLHIIEKRKYNANLKWKPDGKNGLFLSNRLSFLCRTPFNRMDYHKFEFINGFFERNNRRGYRLTSSFPFVWNENSALKLELLQKQKFIDLNIEENSLAQKVRVVALDKKWNFAFKHKYLQNHFNITESSQYSLDNQIFPSDEYSFKYRRIFFDEIDLGIVHTGKKMEGDVLLGFNDNYSKYLKFGLKMRNYFRIFDPQTQNYPSLRYINLENVCRVGLYLPLDKKQNLINNLLNLNNFVPGFKSIGNRYPSFDPNSKDNTGDYKGNQFFLINTLKVNFYDYPVMKIWRVVPFVHLTGVISTENIKDTLKKKKNFIDGIRISGGIGMKFENLEIIYNIGHFQKKNDFAAKFQILLCK